MFIHLLNPNYRIKRIAEHIGVRVVPRFGAGHRISMSDSVNRLGYERLERLG
jgi:hypothetical protein